nr:hypothetical protein [Kibdelosporangium sp. MJ126-NF4]
MGVTAWLMRHMAVRPFLVSTPGGTETRLAAEREFRKRGWRPAVNPVEANLLVVAGGPVDVDVVWRQMPLPRARAAVVDADEVTAALDAAMAELRDPERQRDAGAPDGANGHESHGHESHGMAMPGGIAMADRAEDRDGLTLDVLHVHLGPVLADWPPGLVVEAVMQGDVLQEVTVEVRGTPGGYWTAERVPARRLDSAARLLSVAGWESAAEQATRLRDKVLAGEGDAEVGRWARTVRRSRALRWSLRGVGEWRGLDAWDRLIGWLDHDDLPIPGLDQLPALLTGRELATARLVVASIDPDTDHG